MQQSRIQPFGFSLDVQPLSSRRHWNHDWMDHRRPYNPPRHVLDQAFHQLGHGAPAAVDDDLLRQVDADGIKELGRSVPKTATAATRTE